MVFFSQRTSLIICSSILGLVALSGFGDRVWAQKLLQVNQEEVTPAYPASPPPPRREPLPNQRRRIENTKETDFRVKALQADYTGNLWVGYGRGLTRINPHTGEILARVSLPSRAIGAMVQDKVGRLWVGSYEGLKRVDPRSNEITAQNLFLPSKRVLSLQVDKRGYVWAGTDNGLALISPDEGLIMTTLKKLPGVSANAMTLDAERSSLGWYFRWFGASQHRQSYCDAAY